MPCDRRLFSSWILVLFLSLVAGLFVTAAKPGLAGSVPQVNGIGSGADNLARLTWTNANGSTALWRINASGPATVTNYGPFAGWTAIGVAVGPNNNARLLWTHTPDNQASLWNVAPAGTFTSKQYGPYAGWTATALAVGGNNAPRILWKNTNGAVSLWNVDATSGAFTSKQYGPYAGWAAAFLAVGPNNNPRLLWTNTNGTFCLWNVTGPTFTSAQYGPYAGWSPIGMTVDSANAPRILWNHPADNTVNLWKVAANNTFTSKTYTDPTGFIAKGVSAGSDGTVSLLWSKTDGTAQIWVINADGSIKTETILPSVLAVTVAPSPVNGGQGATGAVTLNAPAFPGGMTVTLSSDNATATVPASILVPAGATSVTFPVTTTNPSAVSATAKLSAAMNGVTQTTSLTVTHLTSVASVSVSPNPLAGGQTATGTVTLNAAALPGGTVVTLASDNALAVVPANITVPAGATSKTFSVTTTNPDFGVTATANISATYNNVAQKTALSLTHTAVQPTTGIYRLTTKGLPNLALDVVGFGTGNGSTVQVWNAGQTCNQQWLVEAVGDGTYKIHAYGGRSSTQMLDDTNGATTNGTSVKTYQDNGNDAQRWYFVEVGGGYYRIVPKNAGATSTQTLDISGGNSAAAGSVTGIYPYIGLDNQKFHLDDPGPAQPTPGVYSISPRIHPELALDVNGFGNANGTNVEIYASNHTSNQQWKLATIGSNIYQIYAYSGMNSLQMLDDASGSLANGNNVTTYEDNGSANQQWYFGDVGNGYYRIIPKNAGPTGTATLDVRGGGSATSGSTLNIYGYYGGDNQVFALNDPGTFQLLPSPKKGVGGRDAQTGALGVSWMYTWGADKPSLPSNVEFVPMEWGYYGGDNSAWIKDRAAQAGVKNFLAFNEPDHTDQANLSVADALTGYQYLASAGLPIGSPACADDNDSWFSSFMAGATSAGYRVDFITVHNYIRDPYAWEAYITNLHNVYWQYPMWITEFGPADWSGSNPVSDTEAMNFMKIVVPWLNSQWYVARYAWYTGSSYGTGTLGSAALVYDDGSLTPLGQLYSRY